MPLFFYLAQAELVGSLGEQQYSVLLVVESGHSRLDLVLFCVLADCLELK